MKNDRSLIINITFNNFSFMIIWNPYIKRDGTSLLILFSIKDFKQESINLLLNDTIEN